MSISKSIAAAALLGALVWGQSSFSFPKVKLVVTAGSTENAQLVFLHDQHLVSIHSTGHDAIDVPYDKVVRLSYWRAEQSQTGKKIAAGALTYGIGALLIKKAVVYHFFIDYEGQGAVRQVELLLDKSDWGEVLNVARTETGKEVSITTAAPQPAVLTADGQPVPQAGQGQPAAASAPAEQPPAAPAPPTPPPASAPPAPPAAPSTPAALTVTSTPIGADIQVNGAFAGSTPSTLKLDAGAYSILVEKPGYASWQRSLTLTAASAVAIDAQLTATATPALPTPGTSIPVAAAPDSAAPSALPAVKPSPAGDLLPVKQGGRWGYIDALGQIRVSPQFDFAAVFSEGRAVVGVGHEKTLSMSYLNLRVTGTEFLFGWIDESGRLLVRTESTLNSPFSEGLAISGHASGSTRESCSVLRLSADSGSTKLVCAPESRVDIIDKMGNVVLQTSFSEAQKFTEKFAPVAAPTGKNSQLLWGFIDTSGKVVVDPAFQAAHSFEEGLAAVEVEHKGWGYIDHTGAFTIPAAFHRADDFSEGLAAVEFTAPKPLTGKAAHEAHALQKDWGYIDRTGAHAIPPAYVTAQQFYEGLAAVEIEGEVVPDNPGAKNPRMTRHSKWGFIDRTGRLVIAGPFEEVLRFSGGLAPVKQNGLWGFVDTAGAFRIPAQFAGANIFRGDLASVKLGDKWGFIDRTGKFVVAPQFEDAH